MNILICEKKYSSVFSKKENHYNGVFKYGTNTEKIETPVGVSRKREVFCKRMCR